MVVMTGHQVMIMALLDSGCQIQQHVFGMEITYRLTGHIDGRPPIDMPVKQSTVTRLKALALVEYYPAIDAYVKRRGNDDSKQLR